MHSFYTYFKFRLYFGHPRGQKGDQKGGQNGQKFPVCLKITIDFGKFARDTSICMRKTMFASILGILQILTLL